MTETTPPLPRRHRHADRVRELLDRADARSDGPVAEAAALVLDAIEAGGIVHAAGSGHSLALVFEAFYRAGGLAPVRPLWDPAILALSGALTSTEAERERGRGESLLRERAPAPPDVAVVFSTSGRNPYPVEIARGCADRGVPVIAMMSSDASARAAARSEDTLADHATVVLDTAVPPGDVAYPAGPGRTPRTAAVSTILAAYTWSLLLAELDDLAAERGTDLPRWTSANVPGGDERNAELLRRYGARIPELAADPSR